MKKYLSEAIGTFALVFCGTGAIIINEVSGGAVTHLGVAVTFGLIVLGMIYALGDVSGAHMNPAVTIGFWISKRLPVQEVFPYIAGQLAGGLLASASLLVMFPGSKTLGATLPTGSDIQSFALEVILSFILMFVIINVATGSKEKGLMAGIAVGAIVGLEATFAGPISGASMNPARSLAPAIMSSQFDSLWIYLTAPFLGTILGVLAFNLIKR